MGFVLVGRGFCPGGFCPGSFCPGAFVRSLPSSLPSRPFWLTEAGLGALLSIGNLEGALYKTTVIYMILYVCLYFHWRLIKSSFNLSSSIGRTSLTGCVPSDWFWKDSRPYFLILLCQLTSKQSGEKEVKRRMRQREKKLTTRFTYFISKRRDRRPIQPGLCIITMACSKPNLIRPWAHCGLCMSACRMHARLTAL